MLMRSFMMPLDVGDCYRCRAGTLRSETRPRSDRTRFESCAGGHCCAVLSPSKPEVETHRCYGDELENEDSAVAESHAE